MEGGSVVASQPQIFYKINSYLFIIINLYMNNKCSLHVAKIIATIIRPC